MAVGTANIEKRFLLFQVKRPRVSFPKIFPLPPTCMMMKWPIQMSYLLHFHLSKIAKVSSYIQSSNVDSYFSVFSDNAICRMEIGTSYFQQYNSRSLVYLFIPVIDPHPLWIQEHNAKNRSNWAVVGEVFTS